MVARAVNHSCDAFLAVPRSYEAIARALVSSAPRKRLCSRYFITPLGGPNEMGRY